MLTAQRIYSAQRYTARSTTLRPALHSAQHCTLPSATLHRQHGTAFRARGSKPFAESRAQRQAGVRRSVQRSTASAATTRNASESLRAGICFQHSAYTARSATLRPALHIAQHYTARCATHFTALHYAHRYTAPSATLRPALHCAQRCTARSITQRPALHCTEHSEPRQGRMQQPNQAGCAKGGCCVFFVVRTPELAP